MSGRLREAAEVIDDARSWMSLPLLRLALGCLDNRVADAAQRRVGALGMLENTIANDYSRKAQIANARDRFASTNNQTNNNALQQNWNRSNSISDQNTGLQNTLVNRNTDQFLGAKQGVKNSRNSKRGTIANYYGGQAGGLRGQASQRGNAATSMFNTGMQSLAKSAQGFADAF